MVSLSSKTELKFTSHQFKFILLDVVLDKVQVLIAKLIENTGVDFIKRDPTPLLKHETLSSIAESIKVKLKELKVMFPEQADFCADIERIVQSILPESDCLVVLSSYNAIMRRFSVEPDTLEGGDFQIKANADSIFVEFDPAGQLQTHPKWRRAIERDESELSFLASASARLQLDRKNNTSPTSSEVMALGAAKQLLATGAVLPSNYQSLGTTGFRPVQTCLSIADPGEGHINVTAKDTALLNGVVVHVEHIDRDKEFDKEKVEPYRLPASINAAHVRLHVGDHAPVTAFIGRPVFESGDFSLDLLKSVHMTASACSAMFRNGIADCKVGVERMTTSQAIEFLNAVAGNVLRDKNRQYLSAAFNINTHLLEDRPSVLGRKKKPILIEDPYEIAKVGIEICEAGGFDKVTWDGASNQVPSVPIIEQLKLSQFISLVHTAHEKGLETYISAGLKAHHMRPSTYSGVDGIGIGTSLHYFDAETRLMGALKPEAMLEALAVRDEASKEKPAILATFLARLDRMFFEGTLTGEENNRRIELFASLVEGDFELGENIMSELQHLSDLPNSSDPSVLGHAKRILARSESNLIIANEKAENWHIFVGELESAFVQNDSKKLEEMLCR